MFPANKYLLRKKIFKLIGHEYEVFNEDGSLALFVHQEGFKLRESLLCYPDKSKTKVLFTIKARNIIDFGATYDIADPASGERIGALRRKGFKSMLQDEWLILNAKDEEIGKVHEDSMAMALVRRFLSGLVPQDYDAFIGETYVADYKQNFNPFVYKLGIDFSKDTENLLDRRLGIAVAILLAAIEGKQGGDAGV